MIAQFAIGSIMIALTFTIQAFSFDFIIRKAQWLETTRLRKMVSMWKAFTIIIVTLGVTCTLIVQIWVWALFYLSVGALSELESALYFSTATFTTVGYGDITLTHHWRLLSSVESINGFLIFGWATAFLFEIINGLYRKESRALGG